MDFKLHWLFATLIVGGAWFIDRSASEKIQVNGIGASLPSTIYREWIVRYQIVSGVKTNPIRLKYIGSNSYLGKTAMKRQIKATNNISSYVFAGSNSDFTDKEYLENPTLTVFPVMSGAVVIVYNVAGVQLKLDLKQLVAIFSRKVKRWNDPILTHNNPDLKDHDHDILIVARQDPSDSTRILTSVLADTSEEWRKTRGVFITGQQDETNKVAALGWPLDTVYMYGKGTGGVLAFVSSLPYTIGYASFAGARTVNLQIAELKNKMNVLIPTSRISRSVRSATDYAMKTFGTRLVASLTNAPTPDGYPLATYTYMLLNKTTSPSVECSQMVAFLRFANWFFTDPTARQIAISYSMVPLAPVMVEKVQEKVLKKVTCRGQNLWKLMAAEMADELGVLARNRKLVLVQTTLLIGLFFGLIVGCGFLQKYRLNKAANDKSWLWDENSLKLFVKSSISVGSRNTLEAEADNVLQKISKRQKFATSQDQTYVMFEATFKRLPDNFSLRSNRTVNDMITRINHDGVMRLSGIVLLSAGLKCYYLYLGQDVNWLHFVFKTSKFNVSDEVRLAIAIDAGIAVEYLHSRGIVHTTLNSMSCFLDAKWSVKIGDWCKKDVYESEGGKINWCSQLAAQINSFLETIDTDEPEQRLILQYIDPHVFVYVNASDAACEPMDLYSYGLLLVEMWTKFPPLHENNSGVPMIEGIRGVLSGRMKVEIPDGVEESVRNLVKMLTDPNDEARPNMKNTLDILRKNKSNESDDGIVSTLMRSMEEYLANLEVTIQERTVELRNTTEKVESLLRTMLPREVATKLQAGEHVEPEFFNEATIYFSDIIGFTQISAESSPLQIVTLLNKVYVLFDDCIDQFDVYKVETIGDAYMCVSGVPDRNEHRHIGEITKMSISIVKSMSGFVIPHTPGKPLQIRIGINSGPVMAGVVGITMPRYCLFGDAVNTASRMESTSKAMRIHASKTLVSLLRIHYPDDFKCTKRGVIEVKGKGQMETFWIHEQGTNFELCQLQSPDDMSYLEEEEVVLLDTDKDRGVFVD